MGWNSDGFAGLKRIVAMLFLLANLADLASLRPLRVRRRVVPFLYEAEMLARSLVAGAALDLVAAPSQMGPAEPVFMPDGTDVAAAASLACRLRALAFVLAHVLMLIAQLQRNAESAERLRLAPAIGQNRNRFLRRAAAASPRPARLARDPPLPAYA